MLKWCKFLIAFSLLPVCAGGLGAFTRAVRANVGEQSVTTWVAIAGGAISWLVIFWLLPKPMLIYVFGHELTHAVWTWAFGGKVKRFKASARGGHVIVTRNNFLIALAPYFFPVYALLVIALFFAGDRIWNWSPYLVWFHLLLGAAYAFHLTLTLHVLKTEQSDITQHGYLFSAVIIFLGNLTVLMLAVPMLGSQAGVAQAFRWWGESTFHVLEQLKACFARLR